MSKTYTFSRIAVACLATGLLSISGSALCATFSQNLGGLNGAASIIKVDGTADYTSLAEAANDFSNFPLGAQSNYTFYLASDLTETSISCFGNSTNGFRVSLKPQDTTRTVVFSRPYLSPPSLSLDGYLIVGSPRAESSLLPVSTHGFTIDGELPGTTHGLVLTTTADVVNATVGSSFNSTVVNVFANSDFVTIRNCVITNNQTTGTARRNGVRATPYTQADVPLSPDSLTLENCHIQALNNACAGIRVEWIGAGAHCDAKSMTIQRNNIVASIFGLVSYSNCDEIIRDNRIRIFCPFAAQSASGFYFRKSENPGHSQITRNWFDLERLTSASVPNLTGIYVASGASVPVKRSVDFTNNFISFNVHGVAPYDTWSAIQFIGMSSSIRLSHNSIYLEQVSSSPPANDGVISFTYDASAKMLTNNIIRNPNPGLAVLWIIGSSQLVSDGNVFSHTAGNRFIRLDQRHFNSLDLWQTFTGNDLHAQSIDMASYWQSPTDLHLNALPPQMLPGILDTQTTPILDDVDGDGRSPIAPTRGADELPVDLMVTFSSPSQAITNQNTSLAFDIANKGVGVIYETTLTVTLPSGFVVSGANSSAGTAVVSGGQAIFALGVIDPGTSVSAQIHGAFNKTGSLQVLAAAETSQSDADHSNNVSAHTITVTRGEGPDLSGIWLAAEMKSKKHSNRLTATLLVFNNGSESIKKKFQLATGAVPASSAGQFVQLQNSQIRGLKQGAFKKIKLRSRKLSVTGPFTLHTFLDSVETIGESDEGNNVVVSDLLSPS